MTDEVKVQEMVLSPKREHLEPLIFISYEQFSLFSSFAVSSTLTPFLFLLGSFVPLVRGLVLADSLFRLFMGHLRISIPVSVRSRHIILVDTAFLSTHVS